MRPGWHTLAGAWWRKRDGLLVTFDGYPGSFFLHHTRSANTIRLPCVDVDSCLAYVDRTMPFSVSDAGAMRLALGFASMAQGTEPNPAVGCVIMSPMGHMVGSGYTMPIGGKHAEAVAITDALAYGEPPQRCTLYTTLEPCSHRGRTPPCTEAILAQPWIESVVYGAMDPNPAAAGGHAVLARSLPRVLGGVLSNDCEKSIEAHLSAEW